MAIAWRMSSTCIWKHYNDEYMRGKKKSQKVRIDVFVCMHVCYLQYYVGEVWQVQRDSPQVGPSSQQ